MTPLDTAVIATNAAMAFVAAAANGYAATRSDPRLRPIFGAIGALALVYSVSYLWLLKFGDVVLWSRVLRGVSPLAWFSPWFILPVLQVRHFRADRKQLDEASSP